MKSVEEVEQWCLQHLRGDERWIYGIEVVSDVVCQSLI